MNAKSEKSNNAAALSGSASGGILPRADWVDVFEEWAWCEHCRQEKVAVVRENIRRHYKDDAEMNHIRNNHRLHYTCGKCGYSTTWIVPAKRAACDPAQWEIGTGEEFKAFNALVEEVKIWHDSGLVEYNPNRITPMSIFVWDQAGQPTTGSTILDEVNKGYAAACRENRVVAYCNYWRERLERDRSRRMVELREAVRKIRTVSPKAKKSVCGTCRLSLRERRCVNFANGGSARANEVIGNIHEKKGDKQCQA
jgi:predicted nucleic-acid-binding Zn-ribbon protein